MNALEQIAKLAHVIMALIPENRLESKNPYLYDRLNEAALLLTNANEEYMVRSLLKMKREIRLAGIRNKLSALEIERNRKQLQHDQSSDYNTPASHVVASLNGQIIAIQWVLKELENV